MTAKQELLEIVERLSEEAAERVLPVAKRECKEQDSDLPSARSLEVLRAWWAAGAAASDDEVRAYDELIANLEPVRFKLADEW